MHRIGGMLRSMVAVVLCTVCGACAAPGPAPFQEPVDGAQSNTEWIPEDPPRLGAAGESLTPEAMVERLAEQERGTFPGADVSSQVIDHDDGTVSGYLRATMPASDHPFRAVDTRMTIVPSNGGWEITSLERRLHCATEEPSRDFCQ